MNLSSHVLFQFFFLFASSFSVLLSSVSFSCQHLTITMLWERVCWVLPVAGGILLPIPRFGRRTSFADMVPILSFHALMWCCGAVIASPCGMRGSGTIVILQWAPGRSVGGTGSLGASFCFFVSLNVDSPFVWCFGTLTMKMCLGVSLLPWMS